jgi:hypothetical protein
MVWWNCQVGHNHTATEVDPPLQHQVQPDRGQAPDPLGQVGRTDHAELVETGEQVIGVPAKLAARVRLFDTGHNRRTDVRDALSVAIVAVRTKNLWVLQLDGELEARRMFTDRCEALTRRRVQTSTGVALQALSNFTGAAVF